MFPVGRSGTDCGDVTVHDQKARAPLVTGLTILYNLHTGLRLMQSAFELKTDHTSGYGSERVNLCQDFVYFIKGKNSLTSSEP